MGEDYQMTKSGERTFPKASDRWEGADRYSVSPRVCADLGMLRF